MPSNVQMQDIKQSKLNSCFSIPVEKKDSRSSIKLEPWETRITAPKIGMNEDEKFKDKDME